MNFVYRNVTRVQYAFCVHVFLQIFAQFCFDFVLSYYNTMCACYSKDVQKMEFILLKDYELRGKILPAIPFKRALLVAL